MLRPKSWGEVSQAKNRRWCTRPVTDLEVGKWKHDVGPICRTGQFLPGNAQRPR